MTTRWKRTIVLLIGAAIALGSFYLFSREIRRGVMTRVDFDATVRVQNKIPSRFDELWDDGAIFIDPVVSSVLVLALTLWAFLRPTRKKFRLGAFLIPLAFFMLTAMEVYGKSYIFGARTLISPFAET
ncbi:hypothetical protein HY031_01750 [Candidatus Gottesmanbacteria bacterium]|nr:hypothetical protein [Candidatus Gottesmanbacteria bacterium]